MGKLSQHIIDELLKQSKQLLLVRNPDGFLKQKERLIWLDAHGIKIVTGNSLKLRVFFETELKRRTDDYKKIIFLVESEDQVLEDIRKQANYFEFQVKNYLPEFHEAVTVSADVDLLDYLYENKPLKTLGRNGSIKYVVENYYEVDADHFSTKEATLVKWIKLYEREKNIPDYIKRFLSSPSEKHFDSNIFEDQDSLFGYLQEEWEKYVKTRDTDIDFTHVELSALLNLCFLNGLLSSSDKVNEVNEPVSKVIPFGFERKQNAITKEQISLPLLGELELPSIKWESAISPISEVIRKSLKYHLYDEIEDHIQKLNSRFQTHLKKNYKENILPSSSIKRPKVVSKVLDHISQNTDAEEKVALIVIDGMAYWQWLMLRDQLKEDGIEAEQNLTYSWLPSITQLSRQALFRGGIPDLNYTQNPRNESKLWSSYWGNKNIPQTQIRYQYGSYDFKLTGIETRFTFVDTVLDNRMHSCGTYQNLFSITKNWIKTGKLLGLIDELKKNNFRIYLTTDHGNIQAKGWRNLRQYERFGGNRSGSRSSRHIEYYVDESLADQFLENNPELSGKIVKDEETLYLTDNSAFTNEETLVTHGGSHFLEVLIPFVKIL